MATVLVVDDVANLAEQYAYDLQRVGGYATRVATGGEAALTILASEAVDCVILDLEMPGIDGFEVLRRLRKEGYTTPVIVYTGTGDYDRCAKAIKLGAYSFIDKSEAMERVAREVDNALEKSKLEDEIALLKRDLGADTPLVGSSQAMQSLKAEIGRLANIPSTVLIMGESGTGKELVARELHRMRDAAGPFVAVNSAAMPSELMESELFGHERGAFTGANRTRRGAFELAGGGTLFLDEIGEMPASAQAKLLRVLEQNEITRLGGETVIKVDARVVAATNRDLDAEAEAGGFRQDLLYRLNVHTVRVPPLRERLSDVAELFNHFWTRATERFGMKRAPVDPAVHEALMQYDWSRNNVRELRNVVERMVIAGDSRPVTVADIPAEVRGGDAPAPQGGTFQERKSEAERQIVIAALERNDWHVTETAKDLGLADHASLLKIMRRHNIKKD